MTGSLRAFAALYASLAAASAAEFHIYIGRITPTSVLVAWGTTQGSGNTIGRGARSYGQAELRIGQHSVTTERSWAEIGGLAPDTTYNYEVLLNGARIGGSTVRTWPERAERLAFLVIGDYGTGSHNQQLVADAMWQQYQRRAAGNDPVRFVLTVGDNIYADVNMVYFARGSGDRDRDWERKFFRPYRQLLAHVPFYPTLGNHDGNASENQGDLPAYLDNFFFPGNRPARWYEFSFGGLADFFALDTTDNTLEGRPRPAYLPGGEQFAWLRRVLAASRAPWKIPYFHHPLFNAGPEHGASLAALASWFDLFSKSGVRVVFAGHEHNFQISRRDQATRGILFVITGAGGRLRRGNVRPNMAPAHIAGWAAQRHFLDVNIEGRTLGITPLSYEPVHIKDGDGKDVATPIVVTLPK